MISYKTVFMFTSFKEIDFMTRVLWLKDFCAHIHVILLSVRTALNACTQLRHVSLCTKLHISAAVFACFGPVIPAAAPVSQQ